MLKTLVVIGTRPEAIKMAPVVQALKNNNRFSCLVCVTAQHRSMLDQVLDFFEITPDFDLNVMQPNQSLNRLSAKIIDLMDGVLESSKPDIVLVHGDTNTSFAAALAAFYRQIPVGHVEAGMRTWNLNFPFPEEANRILTSQITSVHFAPTALNITNLVKSGVPKNKIVKTGNTVIDSLLFTVNKVKGFSNQVNDMGLKLAVSSGKKIILVTGHRRENFGKGFENICKALLKVAKTNPNVIIVYPVHLNPNIKNPIETELGNTPNIILTDPLSYPDFVFLMKEAYLIMTDSGGIQEEGPSLGKPVLVMRDVTERPEAIKSGTVKLVGTNINKIVQQINLLLSSKTVYTKMSKKTNPYGDGKAAERITKWLQKNATAIKKLQPK
jgi:UDP-N-acetylglucosamine 2-epimerase (non-hydrolysing)